MHARASGWARQLRGGIGLRCYGTCSSKPVPTWQCPCLPWPLLLLQDGSMFKAQVEYAPYFYLHVKVRRLLVMPNGDALFLLVFL